MNDFNYIQVNSVAAAIAENTNGNQVAYLAGGTNLLDLWKYNVANPEMLVDLNPIAGHRSVTENDGGGLTIGALLTNAETAYHPQIEQRYPLLSRAILAGASAQIRNMATNGGNLLQRTRCYYFYDPNSPCNKRNPGSGCSALNGYNRIHAILGASEHCIAVFPSDMSVALAALGATVNVAGKDGERNIPFGEFHRLPGDRPEIDHTLNPGEIITSITLPPKGFNQNYSYLKLRDRHSYAFALVSVGMGLELEDGKIKEARIALGGVAHRPWRVVEAEDMLVGLPPTADNFAKAANVILEGAKGLKYNHFKIELAKRAIVRNGLMALDPNSQIPGAGPS